MVSGIVLKSLASTKMWNLVDQFSEHFGNIMTISGEISEEEQNIESKVNHWYFEIVKYDNKYDDDVFTTDKIAKMY